MAMIVPEYPPITGKNGTQGLYEIHVFLGPLNPSDELVACYRSAVSAYNAANGTDMKPCFLELLFRSPESGGEPRAVRVMQSALYVRADSVTDAIAIGHEHAKYFESLGLPSLRVKVEGSLHSLDGIPETAEEAARWPHMYHEFHIKVSLSDHPSGFSDTPLEAGDEELKALRVISSTLSRQLGVPIPLSRNLTRNVDNSENPGLQRFLNLRAYGVGRNAGLAACKSVENAINGYGSVRMADGSRLTLRVRKTIAEIVLYDTNREMDQGWIDPIPGEVME